MVSGERDQEPSVYREFSNYVQSSIPSLLEEYNQLDCGFSNLAI